MNQIALMAYLIVLGFLAVQDFKYRKVSDLGLCALWLVALLFTQHSFMMCLSFLVVWIIGEVGALCRIKTMGWGDILFLPSFVAVANALQLPLVLAPIGIITGIVTVSYFNYEKNNYPMLLLGFLWLEFWSIFYFISTIV